VLAASKASKLATATSEAGVVAQLVEIARLRAAETVLQRAAIEAAAGRTGSLNTLIEAQF
jgi:hypothetical protein